MVFITFIFHVFNVFHYTILSFSLFLYSTCFHQSSFLLVLDKFANKFANVSNGRTSLNGSSAQKAKTNPINNLASKVRVCSGIYCIVWRELSVYSKRIEICIWHLDCQNRMKKLSKLWRFLKLQIIGYNFAFA